MVSPTVEKPLDTLVVVAKIANGGNMMRHWLMKDGIDYKYVYHEYLCDKRLISNLIITN